MKRVADPLRKIGADIDGRVKGNLSPIAIRGAKLDGFDYASPISSAQVKSAMILAALNAKEMSCFSEPTLSRDHTERMLRGMGAEIIDDKGKIRVVPMTSPLKPLNLRVPADPSSAFFFAVAAAITPNSRVVIQDVSLNPTRVEAYRVLERMGAYVEFLPKEEMYEPIGDIVVQYGQLSGVEVSENIAWLIDELPALSIAMAVAKGKSVVKNARELRVKESDRITTVVDNLKLCGIEAREFDDGYEITGGVFKEGLEVDSYGDHRIAMSFAIAGLLSDIRVTDVECINTSFPNFVDILKKIGEVKNGD
jgi:3-phosphoshikimate 1-carboxyvinyltransferase